MYKSRIIRKESEVLSRVNLGDDPDIKAALENKVRDKPFTRLCLSDRCISILGKTYNYMTGHNWDYIYKDSGEVLNDSSTEEKGCVSLNQPMPFSQQHIALFRSNGKFALVLKNDPSSRKLCTMDRRRKDILAFEMISNDLILVKLKDEK